MAKKEKKIFTIKELIELTGKSRNSIYRYIKSGTLKASKIKERGKSAYIVSKTDLESFLNYKSKKKSSPSPVQSPHDLKKILQTAVKEAISAEINSFFKQIDGKKGFYSGNMEKEIESLKAEKIKLQIEKEELEEKLHHQGKIRSEKLELLERLDKKAERVRELEKQIEAFPGKPESISQTLLENAENIRVLQKERDTLQAISERTKNSLNTMKAENEYLKAKLEKEKKEKAEMVEVLKKELKFESNKPWWKKIID